MSPSEIAEKTRPSTKLRPLEFRVFRRLQDLGAREGLEIAQKRILVACSGGKDSVALVSVLSRLSCRFDFQLVLAHVHHGKAETKELTLARDKAQAKVEALAKQLRLPLLTARWSGQKLLRSEAELRDFRLQTLREWSMAHEAALIAFAHHADDLLETRLIRLIRGTGAQGLEAMTEFNGKTLRPLLTLTRVDIDAYAEQASLSWVEDLSNQDIGPLRNWIRQSWLPSLEEKRAGGVKALRASLENLVQTCHRSLDASDVGMIGGVIDRQQYLGMEVSQQRQCLASYLRHLGAKHFEATHIEELRKRLKTPKKSFNFVLLRFRWEINAGQIQAFPRAF